MVAVPGDRQDPTTSGLPFIEIAGSAELVALPGGSIDGCLELTQ
jgi:hypothetical protein